MEGDEWIARSGPWAPLLAAASTFAWLLALGVVFDQWFDLGLGTVVGLAAVMAAIEGATTYGRLRRALQADTTGRDDEQLVDLLRIGDGFVQDVRPEDVPEARRLLALERRAADRRRRRDHLFTAAVAAWGTVAGVWRHELWYLVVIAVLSAGLVALTQWSWRSRHRVLDHTAAALEDRAP